VPNGGSGIFVSGVNRLQDVASNTIRNNHGDGVTIDGGSGNVIASNMSRNDGYGVVVRSGKGNLISRNAILANGRGYVDLGADGRTPNDPLDADDGANGLQNFPVVRRVRVAPDGLRAVTYALHSKPGRTYRLEFFL